MSEFTKGPWKWKVKETNDWHYKYLEDANGVDVIELSDQYDGPPECGSDIVMEISPANAHLISAAPDMYAALKGCFVNGVDVADKGNIGGKSYSLPITKGTWDAAKKAIEKAEGKQ